MTSYCSLAMAAQSEDETSNITQKSSDSPTSAPDSKPITEPVAPPIITLEQMQVRLKEAKGKSIKLDDKGEVLAADAASWDCLHQKNTGLTWEVKKMSGLRDKTNTYTWTEHKPQQNELFSWFEYLQGK